MLEQQQAITGKKMSDTTPDTQHSEAPEAVTRPKLDMTEMFITYISPAVFGKLLTLFFGSYYSSHPGEGYGIGLVICIVFTLAMLARFVWKYRHLGEEEF